MSAATPTAFTWQYVPKASEVKSRAGEHASAATYNEGDKGKETMETSRLPFQALYAR